MPHLPPAPHRSRHDTRAHADGTTRWTDGVRALRYALLRLPCRPTKTGQAGRLHKINDGTAEKYRRLCVLLQNNLHARTPQAANVLS